MTVYRRRTGIFVAALVVFASTAAAEVWINHKSCGIPSLNVRIINGLAAAKDNFPWVVFLYVKYLASLTRCAGSIITSRHVVTAGHCTMLNERSEAIRITMYYGHNDFQRGRRVRVAGYLRHESFVGDTFYSDVAVLYLSEPIQFSPAPAPSACLRRSHQVLGQPLWWQDGVSKQKEEEALPCLCTRHK
ncbi:trypsin beta-like [Ornithodoros turicata]|uniref:trypsin beta-like n=1 Tax=Ornithodoros turicata TaxID=34597 RepID=UPI003139110A